MSLELFALRYREISDEAREPVKVPTAYIKPLWEDIVTLYYLYQKSEMQMEEFMQQFLKDIRTVKQITTSPRPTNVKKGLEQLKEMKG